MIPKTVYIFLFIELIAVTFGDIKTKKIPNSWAILNIALFFLLMIIFPDHYSLEIRSFIYSMAFLFVGFILYLFKIMGGGDTKFLFSFFLLVPTAVQEKELSFILSSVLIIGLPIFFYSVTQNFKVILLSLAHGHFQDLSKVFGTKFAFSTVIFVSWVWLGWDLRVILSD